MTATAKLANRYTPAQLDHLIAELRRNPVHREPDGALKPGAYRRLYNALRAQTIQHLNRRHAS